MKKFEIIDAHAHIYPQKISKKATDAIGDFYDLKMAYEGSVNNLLAEGKNAGISKFLVHSCATKPEQVHSINVFIKEQLDIHKEFIGFMTLHQDLSEKEMKEEVKWCVENGFKGIKLHPDFQKFNIDDKEYYKIYRASLSANEVFPILFHTGDNRFTYSKPFRLKNVAKEFGEQVFIGAHFGGYRCWDEYKEYTGLNNVYFDTSSSLAFITPEKAKEIIEYFGEDKFFFGTDFPMWGAKEEIERFTAIDLTDEQREKIFSSNIKKLLKL